MSSALLGRPAGQADPAHRATAVARSSAGPCRRSPVASRPGASGGLVVAMRDGIYRAREWGGALTQIVKASTTTRPPRASTTARPTRWAASGPAPSSSRARANEAKLYSIDCRGGARPRSSCRPATPSRPTAWPGRPTRHGVLVGHAAPHHPRLGLGGRGQRMTQAPRVPAVPAKPRAGRLAARRPATAAGPDGAAVDAEGNYFAPCSKAGGLQALARRRAAGRVRTPAQCPTMPCFGGADLKTLYLTTAAQPAREELRPCPIRAACSPCRSTCPACRSTSSRTERGKNLQPAAKNHARPPADAAYQPLPCFPNRPSPATPGRPHRRAAADGTPLRLRGGGTKDFYGQACRATCSTPAATRHHQL
jgi:hypothetical protein